jgi:hypothetical protein
MIIGYTGSTIAIAIEIVTTTATLSCCTAVFDISHQASSLTSICSIRVVTGTDALMNIGRTTK